LLDVKKKHHCKKQLSVK